MKRRNLLIILSLIILVGLGVFYFTTKKPLETKSRQATDQQIGILPSPSRSPKENRVDSGTETKIAQGKIVALGKNTVTLSSGTEKATLNLSNDTIVTEVNLSSGEPKKISITNLKVGDQVEAQLVEKTNGFEITQIIVRK